MQKHVNLVELVKSFPTNILLQYLASIQKRTNPLQFAHLAEESEKGSISNFPTKVTLRDRAYELICTTERAFHLLEVDPVNQTVRFVGPPIFCSLRMKAIGDGILMLPREGGLITIMRFPAASPVAPILKHTMFFLIPS